MTTTIHLNEAELDNQFLQAVKTLFKNRNLTMTIEAEDIDATEHLLGNEINRARLIQAVKHVNEEKNLVEVDMDQLKALFPDA